MSGRFNIDKRSFDPNFSDQTEPEIITSYISDNINSNLFYTPILVHILSIMVLVISVTIIGYYIVISTKKLYESIRNTIKQCYYSMEIFEYSINY